MMRLSTRHWLIAMLLALALHLGVAVGLLLPTEESGARAVGTGGLAVSLSAGGAAPGAVPTVPSEPVSETVKTDQAETVPPDQTTPQTPPAEQVAALPVPTPDSPPPPDALPVLPPATPTEAAPAPVSTKPVEAEAVTPVETPPAKVDTADAKPPRETVAEAVTPPVPRARPAQPTPPPTAVAEPTPVPPAPVAALSVPAGAGGQSGQRDDGAATTHGLDTGQAGGGLPGAPADYLANLQAWLERHKKYPRRSQLRREQGTALLYFVIDRSGQVLDYRVRRTSGHPSLDAAVADMIERAQPLPPPPPDLAQARLELLVPIRFELR